MRPTAFSDGCCRVGAGRFRSWRWIVTLASCAIIAASLLQSPGLRAVTSGEAASESDAIQLRVAEGHADGDHVFRLPPRIFPTGSRSPVVWSVRIQNETGASVTIADPATSCGCTGAVMASDRLSTGAATDFTLQVRPDSSAQVRTAQLLISSETDDRLWQYRLEAPLFPQDAFQRPNVYLGAVSADAPSEVPLILVATALSDDALPELISLESTHAALNAFVAEDAVTSGASGADQVVQREFPVRLRIDPHGPERGHFTAEVKARFFDAVQNAEIEATCDVHWSVPSLYGISPARVFVGSASSSPERIEKRVSISAGDIENLSLTSAASPHPAVSAEVLDDARGPDRRILISIESTEVNGPLMSIAIRQV